MRFFNFWFLTFIITVPVCKTSTDDDIIFAQQLLMHQGDRISCALFVPDDNVKKVLIGLINNERRAIYALQYRISDKDIAFALCQAHKRGVKIRIIIDCSCIEDRAEKISILHTQGISIHRYKDRNSTMHNKIFVFMDNFGHRPIIWTGSANATRSGTLKNQENVLIINDRELVQKYIKKFESLWHQTTVVTNAHLA